MSQRYQRILEVFPEIPRDHILIGSRKDKIDVDILFDDGLHNILNSNAAYPILMRRPWNQSATGIMAVNNYDEFLKFVEIIANSYSTAPEQISLDNPSIVVLVGPSGSGKNDIARVLMSETDTFEKLVSYSTNPMSVNDPDGWYRYISEQEFRKMDDDGQFCESTTYAHHFYGCCKSDIEKILASGKNVLTVMDICGAMALKTLFPHVITIYVKRDRKELITSILKKDCSIEDKANRLLPISVETRNAQVCDYTVKFETAERAAKEISDKLNI
jgi:guanylate kinase